MWYCDRNYARFCICVVCCTLYTNVVLESKLAQLTHHLLLSLPRFSSTLVKSKNSISGDRAGKQLIWPNSHSYSYFWHFYSVKESLEEIKHICPPRLNPTSTDPEIKECRIGARMYNVGYCMERSFYFRRFNLGSHNVGDSVYLFIISNSSHLTCNGS